jgi:hypothetical protein
MIRIALAAAAAFALAAAAPAFACGEDCPMHKTADAKHEHGTTVAAADKAEKKGEKAACACATDPKAGCACEQGKCACHAKKEKTEKKS